MFAIITILLTLTIFIAPILHAQEASTSSAAEAIRNAVKEKVMERIQNVVTRKVGLVGTITNLTEINLKIQANGQEFIITTAADTQYQRIPGKRKLSRDELELNQPVIVLGHQQLDSSTITAGLIQLIPAPTMPKRQTLYGAIDSISTNSLTITTPNQQTWTINTTKSTDYNDQTSTKIITIKATTLKEQDTVIIGGTPDDKKNLTLNAAFVLRLPTTP